MKTRVSRCWVFETTIVAAEAQAKAEKLAQLSKVDAIDSTTTTTNSSDNNNYKEYTGGTEYSELSNSQTVVDDDVDLKKAAAANNNASSPAKTAAYSEYAGGSTSDVQSVSYSEYQESDAVRK